MRSFQGASAALAIVLAGVLQAGQPNFDDYKSFTAPGYTLIARDEVYAVRVARGVAKVDWLLSKMLKHDADVPVAPTYILAVPRPVFIRYFQPGNGIIGEFVPGRFSNYLLIESTRDERELADAVYHEYTHLFLHTRFRGAKPLWFDEGMAEFVQAARFKDTYVEVGRGRYPPSKWIPLNKLLRLDKSSPEYRSLATTNSVHDESWAIVHRGVLADMHFRKQMFGLLDALDELKPIDEAVYANFGMTILQLDASMHDYAQNIAFAEVRLPFETPAKPEPPTGSPLSELATLERIADAMFVSGFQPQNLHEIVEAINQRSPDSPGGRVLRMRLAARDHDDATLSALSREIAPETATPMLARGTGMALFERTQEQASNDPMSAAEREAMRLRALELLDRAIIASPDDPEAVWGFGMLASALHRSLATAARRVSEARQAAPFNPDLAMAAALVCSARGDSDGATKNLSDVVRFSREPKQRRHAIDLLAGLKPGTPLQ